MRLFDLSGKVAVVTGGGRGLGRAMALGLAEAGARVAIAGRGHGELDETVQEAAEKGWNMMAVPCDLTAPDGSTAFLETVIGAWGAVDIALHAAGSQIRKSYDALTPDDWDRITGIHLRTGFFLAQAVMKHLRARQSPGKIILIGSLTSHIGIRNLAPYVASKSGISGLARALAAEGAEHGICVNVIIPGYYHTSLTGDLLSDPEKHAWVMSRIPMKRLGQPEDLSGAAIFLASSASDYVTGSEIRVDGGWLSA